MLFVTPLVVILVVLHSAFLAGTHPASVVVVFLSTKDVVRKQNFWLDGHWSFVHLEVSIVSVFSTIQPV